MAETSFFDSDAENYTPPSSGNGPKLAITKRAAAKKVFGKRKALAVDSDHFSDTLDSPDQSIGPDTSFDLDSSPPKKKTSTLSSKPLAAIENEMLGQLADSGKKAKGTKSATETYQKLTQLEHILKRPDTYVGSIEPTKVSMWVFDSETTQMQYRPVTYVPGLYKIFDEILVNAADNKQRDPNMDTLKITIDRDKNLITVYNNGRGIPIELHNKEKIYIPELIFGHLLTSSNYDDEQKKVTGGRNGYGAKLCNIFSTEFTLETADKDRQKKYKQVWTNNMSKMKPPKITENPRNEEYTRISFTPDLSKFGMDKIDDDFESILKRRVYDMAGCSHDVKVYLNGERIKIRNFKHYVEMYANAIARESGTVESESKPTIIYEKINDRWEIAFSLSDGGFNQVSFVNSIATTSGGSHVNSVADQLVVKLGEQVKKKNKAAPVKPNQIKNQFFLFVNCLIENPAFSSQTKETLTTKPSQFGSKCPIPDSFTKKVMSSGVLESILDFARVKADQAMKRADAGGKRSRITGMVKLEDASKAGTRDGHKCTLILTEGDSAKSLAVAGMSVVGREHFGVFPLRGKLLNVRDATHEAVLKNAEISSIKKILGLQHKKSYSDTKELRYGHLMIMTDQDHDGSHIKGLIINFLEAHFPSLLHIPGFLIEFITPIVKCTKRSNKSEEISFFTLPEYEQWVTECPNVAGWNVKYYKGLGTSSDTDAKKYFSDLDKHLKKFHSIQEGDPALIDMAFSKKKADDRKEWLRLFRPGTFMDHSVDKILISDFINKELILFSMADNVRSIPSVVDGFKPGQRKVLYACFKRNLRAEIKVQSLSGYVSEQTAYHHGEQSLASTIVGMAQNYVGSNNLNLLMPNGQFGTRDKGGKDAASARYIYTELSPLARKVFPSTDDALLKYLDDDGKPIEPEWFAPIIPMVLVNGADGIGTGWSTSIPCYHPLEIVDNLRRLMQGEETEVMHPWFRGFTGETSHQGAGKYKISGKISQIDDDQVEITELPVRKWILDTKEYLDAASTPSEKTQAWITNFEEFHETDKVHFVVTVNPKEMPAILSEGLENRFKLVSSLSTTNMVAFDPEGRIKRYSNPQDILQDFFHVRLDYYHRRKTYMANDLTQQLEKLSNQARFVKMIIDRELVVSNRKRLDLVEELKAKKFKPVSKAKVVRNSSDPAEDEEEAESIESAAVSDYDYLLGMAIWSLTKEKVDRLLQQKAEKEEELNELLKLSPKDMWSLDLDAFVVEWHSSEEKRLKGAAAVPGKKKSNVLGGKRGGKAATKRRAKVSDDEDDSVDDEYSPKKFKKTIKPIQTTLELAASEPAKAKTAPKPRAKAVKKDPEAQMEVYGDPQVRETVPLKSMKTANPALDNDDWAQLAKGIGGGSNDKPLFQTKPKSTKVFSVISSTESSPVKPAARPKKVPKPTAKEVKPSGSAGDAQKERPARSRTTTKKYVDLQEDDSEAEEDGDSVSEAEPDSEAFSD